MQLDKEEIQEAIENKIKEGTKKFGKDFKFFILEIISLEKMLNPKVKERDLFHLPNGMIITIIQKLAV